MSGGQAPATTPAVREQILTELVARRPRPSKASPARASFAFAGRALLKIRHVPEQLADAIMIPAPVHGDVHLPVRPGAGRRSR
jgi:ABC-2 type transport system permease protein